VNYSEPSDLYTDHWGSLTVVVSTKSRNVSVLSSGSFRTTLTFGFLMGSTYRPLPDFSYWRRGLFRAKDLLRMGC
jgi:hypothetical protein